MPFTLFHLGPSLLLGLLLFEYINFPTFIIANVIADVEPLTVLLFGLDYPLHGLAHSFVGGSVIAVALSLIMFIADGRIQGVMSFFRLGQRHSKRSIVLAAFLGVYLHVILDSLLGYADMKPLFPLSVNPFYNPLFAWLTPYFCIVSFILGLGLYVHRVMVPPR